MSVKKEKMITVFRVQDKYGFGMYHSCLDHPDWVEGYHPTPWSDVLLSKNLENRRILLGGGAIFGFKNKTQLRRWLPRRVVNDMSSEYQVVELSIPERHVAFGDAHVVFRRRYAKIVSKTPLHQF